MRVLSQAIALFVLLASSMASAGEITWVNDGGDGWGVGESFAPADINEVKVEVDDNNDRLVILEARTIRTDPGWDQLGQIMVGLGAGVANAVPVGPTGSYLTGGVIPTWTTVIDTGTGYIRGTVAVESTASVAHAISTGAEGQWVMADEAGATQVDLPAITQSGHSVCVYATTAQVLSIAPDAGDSIVIDGSTLTAGNELDSEGNAGDFVCLLSSSGNWYVLGRSGAWVDGGSS